MSALAAAHPNLVTYLIVVNPIVFLLIGIIAGKFDERMNWNISGRIRGWF